MTLRSKMRIAMFLLAMLSWHPGSIAAPNTDAPEPEDKPGSITPDYPANDQSLTVNGKPIQAVLNNKDYVDQLVRYLIGYETWIHLCTDAEPEERLRTLIVSDPLRMPGIEVVARPLWLEVIRVRGCNRTYERLVYATYHEGKPVFHAMVAGSSKTTPDVQHRTVSALRERETVRAHAAGCERADKARVISAELDEDWPDASETQWREIWAVHTCKGSRDVPLWFQTGADGKVTFHFEAP